MKSLLSFALIALWVVSANAAEDKAIKEINAKNAVVKTVTCDVQTVIVRRAVRLSSNGKLYYEKEKNLRLITHAATDNRFMSDIGSNDSYFWVYARRLNPNYVAYASYKDLYKTNLKPSLDPRWMAECFCFGVIDTHKASVQMQGEKLVVIQSAVGTRKQTVYKAITIDPKLPAITGNYIYDSNKELLAYAIVTSHYTTNNGMRVPKTMESGATGEDFTVNWTFSNYKFNAKMTNEVFKMPSFEIKRINLANGEQLRGLND